MNNFALHTSHILQPTLTCPLVVILPVDGCTAATSEVLHAPTAVDSEQPGPPSPDPFTSIRNFELLWKWREIQNEMLQHGSKSVKRKAEIKICAFLASCMWSHYRRKLPTNWINHFPPQQHALQRSLYQEFTNDSLRNNEFTYHGLSTECLVEEWWALVTCFTPAARKT